MAATGDASQPSKVLQIENTQKRDSIIETELRYQKLWQDEKVFEANAPSCADYPLESITPEALRKKIPKFFGTIAYPYVNGSPHIGHAYSVSKIDFATRVARAQGKNTLYPQGYHATGMPIKACADKLKHEMTLFGHDFEGYKDENDDDSNSTSKTQDAAKEDITKFKNTKKSKAALKTTQAKYQFQVMISLGIPRNEIYKFAGAEHWLYHFPQLWQQHLTSFGCGIDWRRSFITTDSNPYYDSFIRWQMRRLKELGKIQFGKRYTVYSPKDGQACLDHDRSVGEGVGTQEYVALKCEVLRWSEKAKQELADQKLSPNAKVYMIPATLRPETVYGQTNLFVSPAITYGFFQVSATEYYVASNRAARNMAFQGVFSQWGSAPLVASIKGSSLIGSVATVPLAERKEVYIVPMSSIKETKGTAIVTSVPTDSPDDFATTQDLFKKFEFYGIKQEWLPDLEHLLPIIETPQGNLIAPQLVKQMKINSANDPKLAEAKDIAYKTGFYQGKMIFGEFAGRSVQDAKGLVQQHLYDSHLAFAYCEPDGLVVSRSNDECVAAFLDQWYLTYGEADAQWRDDVINHVQSDNFNSFSATTKNAIIHSLGWMSQWAVTRQYGLGTKLPWDPTQLVEGLSDSTIYMAYYTVAHYLHSDIYGKQLGIGKVKQSQMVDEVWEYVFGLRDQVKSDIPEDTLRSMRREFSYWYPLDVRVSGKDLIQNHLLFFLYTHQAIWGKIEPRYLPRGIRINGHLLLNGEKMSKSTGNFLTLDNAVQKFGADATRIALADGGDLVEDANFEESVANAAILKLFELRKWMEDVILEKKVVQANETYQGLVESEKLRNSDRILRNGPKGFWDKLFDNDLNSLVQETVGHLEATHYKSALKSGFYDFTTARDQYRIYTSSASIGMHEDCVERYVELQALIMSVIIPHWSEHVWREILKKPSTVQFALFPSVADPIPSLTAIYSYIRSSLAAVGSAEGAMLKKLSKGKATSFNPNLPKRLSIFVTKTWPAWQAKYIELAEKLFNGLTLDVSKVGKSLPKSEMKTAMPFMMNLKQRLESGEPHSAVFTQDLGFDELQVLQEMTPSIQATVPKLQEVEIFLIEESDSSPLKTAIKVFPAGGKAGSELPQSASSAQPGSPAFVFSNI